MVNRILLCFGLLCVLSAHGMKPIIELQESLSSEEYAQHAEEYEDKECLLFAMLPNEKLVDILSWCCDNKSIEDAMESFIKLRPVCNRFNDILRLNTIGKLCKNYDLSVKNRTLKNIIKGMDDIMSYASKRISALILVHAGADLKARLGLYLLENVIEYNDIELAKVLCHYKIDLNLKEVVPLFFHINTVKMAQLFVDNGVDLHAQGVLHINVLWAVIKQKYAAELLEFYLKKGVNAKELDYWSKDCLLHKIASTDIEHIENVDNFLKKVDLLLEAIPDMVNHKNARGETPLDVALESLEFQESLKEMQEDNSPEAFEQLIEVLKKHITQ